MSRLLGAKLPDRLFEILKGEDITPHLGKVVLLVTVDSQGFPHPAMLSLGEVAAKDKENIRLATYKGSTTSKNLRERGKVAMVFAEEGMTYYVKGEVTQLEEALPDLPSLSSFNLKVAQVIEDTEPQAPIISGIRFQLPEGQDLAAEARKVLPAILR